MNSKKVKSAVGTAIPATETYKESIVSITHTDKKIKMIPIENLVHHPDNPRKNIGDIEELTDSIRKNGIMQNLTVVPAPEELGKFWVLIGNRRFEAAKQAGLDELPCLIAEGLTKTEQIGIMLEENIQRNDLTVIEQAQGFQLMFDLGETVQSISKRTGFSEKTVRNRLNIAKLDKNTIVKKSQEWQLTISDLTELEKLENVKLRNDVLRRARDSQDLRYQISLELKRKVRQENEKIYRKMLHTFGIPFDEKARNKLWGSDYEIIKRYELDFDPPKKLEFKVTSDLIFTTNYSTLYVLRKMSKAKKEMTEQEKKRKKIKANCKQAFEIVKAITSEMRLFLEQLIIEKASGLMSGGDFCSNRELRLAWDTLVYVKATVSVTRFCKPLLKKEFYQTNEEDRNTIRKKLSRVPVALQIAYMVVNQFDLMSAPIDDYSGKYCKVKAKGFDDLYMLLRCWGFRFTEDKEDEYESIIDGTSELYTRE